MVGPPPQIEIFENAFLARSKTCFYRQVVRPPIHLEFYIYAKSLLNQEEVDIPNQHLLQLIQYRTVDWEAGKLSGINNQDEKLRGLGDTLSNIDIYFLLIYIINRTLKVAVYATEQEILQFTILHQNLLKDKTFP